MSEKRKDSKGRILRTGESQRKDLTYQFRYTDVTGKRRTIYANDLQELRKKEKAIQKDVEDSINYCEGNVTVIELLERYIALKQGVRHATKAGYNFVLNLAKKEDFCYRTITPHVLRHTFCTNMANAGMDIKSLQYLMGHADAGVTMNVYTHASYDHAAQSMQKILPFKKPEAERKTS